MINLVLRRLTAALMAKRWTRVLALAVAAGLAMAGVMDFHEPAAQARSTPAGAAAESGRYELTGRVVRVADGDTFNLLVQGKQQRVRLASIDAPEVSKDRERPGQAYAQASKEALAALIAGKTLTVLCFERDRYERNICDVPLEDGTTANRKQVQDGMAWANMEGRGKFMRDGKLPELEQQAKRQRQGVWQQPDPVPPWVWRYQCWQKQRC
ncbi:thermonuclease family protein [Pollutimonas sp. H1-120]|uniref:thermonuclease family protein n=1 Tax=Pollutimonas sp. H1-120 TaxID=3148824 RepID=UPI003B51C500